MNYQKIYELISGYHKEINRLDACKNEAESQGYTNDIGYFEGAGDIYRIIIDDLEKLIDDDLGAREILVHEHKADSLLQNYPESVSW